MKEVKYAIIEYDWANPKIGLRGGNDDFNVTVMVNPGLEPFSATIGLNDKIDSRMSHNYTLKSGDNAVTFVAAHTTDLGAGQSSTIYTEHTVNTWVGALAVGAAILIVKSYGIAYPAVHAAWELIKNFINAPELVTVR